MTKVMQVGKTKQGVVYTVNDEVLGTVFSEGGKCSKKEGRQPVEVTGK